MRRWSAECLMLFAAPACTSGPGADVASTQHADQAAGESRQLEAGARAVSDESEFVDAAALEVAAEAGALEVAVEAGAPANNTVVGDSADPQDAAQWVARLECEPEGAEFMDAGLRVASDFRAEACGGTVVLALEEAPGSFDGCGPGPSVPDREYWTPGAETLAHVESRLPALIGGLSRTLPYELAGYCLQHAGFSFVEQRYVVVNAYSETVLNSVDPEIAARFCDGGGISWDAWFSLEKDCFVYFQTGSSGPR